MAKFSLGAPELLTLEQPNRRSKGSAEKLRFSIPYGAAGLRRPLT